MDLEAYLRRMAYNGAIQPTLNNLRALHLAHLSAVPFENLDIHWGKPISLDEDRLFEKIVSSNRGGFCYELNGLFAALLRELGFKVTLLSARVAGKDEKIGPEFDHLTLRVDVDGPWLADVGFGDSFLEPLKLEHGYQSSQAGFEYRLQRQSASAWALVRRKQHQENWELQYVFTLAGRRLEDFANMCAWHQTSPESHFTRACVCTRATPHGRITLSGTRLIVTENGSRTERDIDPNEIASLLKSEFGIDRGREMATHRGA